MLDTGVIYLDVAIGIAVASFLLSLVPSGINEAIAFATRIRSKFLWAYLNQLFTAAGAPSGLDDATDVTDSAAAKAGRCVPVGAPGPAATTEPRPAARTALAARAPAAAASAGLPSTSWEMLRLMRARGARDPRPTLGGGVLAGEAPLDGPATLPVVAELHRRLGPIAVAANAGVATGAKADKPTTTKHIPPRSLARALVDLLTGAGSTPADVTAALDGLAGTPVHGTLASLWAGTSGDLQAFGAELEAWFEAEMARLSGLYKRLMRWVLGAVAVTVALLVNVDPIGLTRDLWRDPDRRADAVAVAEAATSTAGRDDPSPTPELAALYGACRAESAPGGDVDVAAAAAAVERLRNCVTDALDAERDLGLLTRSVWEPEAFAGTWGWSWDGAVVHVVELAVVAAAIFVGAPFWWDVVRRLMGIRRSVVKAET